MNREQDLKHKLDEQNKVINFLKTKYKEDTGAELQIPHTWTNFFGKDRLHLTPRHFKKGDPSPRTDAAREKKVRTRDGYG
jgi:hypothetical protein